MKRLTDELGIISPAAWTIVALIWVTLTGVILALFYAARPGDPPDWMRGLMLVLVPIPLTILAALVAYIHFDARRRGMRHVLWTFLAALIPNAIGIILYFILREPLTVSCRSCGNLVLGRFAFCPACGTAMGRACPACRRPIEAEWRNCAWCGQPRRSSDQ